MGAKGNVLEATLTVTGNIMGSGIFMVPLQLSHVGSVSVWGWISSVVGVSCLALAYAKLSSLEDVCGGSYGFARKHFGSATASLVNATYFLSVVCGNVAGAIVGVGYLSLFLPEWMLSTWCLALVTLATIWVVTLVNTLFGPRAVMRVQGFCTLFTCVPVFFVALCGWTTFDSSVFWASWNVAGVSDVWAVQRGLNVQLWAFTGLETAAVLSSVLRNPTRDVPIATCAGVFLASVGYVLSCTVISGIFPAAELANMTSPFAAAVTRILGSPSAGSAVGLFAMLGCFGSLGAWVLVAGQTAASAAEDGLFPALFAHRDAQGINQRGLYVIALIMTVIVGLCSLPQSGQHPFGIVSSVSSLLTLVPYVVTAAALCRRVDGDVLWSMVGVIGIVYCCAALIGTPLWHTLAAGTFALASVLVHHFFAPVVAAR